MKMVVGLLQDACSECEVGILESIISVRIIVC